MAAKNGQVNVNSTDSDSDENCCWGGCWRRRHHADNSASSPLIPTSNYGAISPHESTKSISFRYIPILASKKEFADTRIEVLTKSTYVPLRHLITAYSNRHMGTILKKFVRPAQYKWYWEDGYTFNEYDESTSRKIEEAFKSYSEDTDILTIDIGLYQYKIIFAEMIQRNVATGKESHIDRRLKQRITVRAPNLESILDKMKAYIREEKFEVQIHRGISFFLQEARRGFIVADRAAGHENIILLKGMADMVEDTKKKLNEHVRKLEDPQIYWEDQSAECELKEVKRGADEWRIVEAKMTDFQFQILKIERVQSKWLKYIYEVTRALVSKKNNGKVNEKRLFHGTGKTEPNKIYNSEQGFDNRLSRWGFWGMGAYFAVRAAYSDRYAYTTKPEGHKQMFMVNVITGVPAEYGHQRDETLTAPPINPTGTSPFEEQRYDSVKGCTSCGGIDSEIYVIYDHGKAYPNYLITYI